MEVSAGGEEKPPREAWKKTPESGGEVSNANNNGGSNGEKPKRKMKSPYQLEVLEQTYAGLFLRLSRVCFFPLINLDFWLIFLFDFGQWRLILRRL